MWTEIAETRVSTIDGAAYQVPALIDDGGTRITRGTILPEMVRVICYARRDITLGILLTQYDVDMEPQRFFVVFLKSALRGISISEDDRLEVMRDLESALPTWKAIVDRGQPNVDHLVFR